MGVFATRSPFRPNPLGLSSVRIARIEKHPTQGPVIHVLGADLMDGTPIYDIKPYIPYTDCHPEARGGFTDTHAIKRLQVVMPAEVTRCLTKKEVEMLEGILALDPRPHYHQDATKVYGMPFEAYDIRFRVEGEVLRVVEVATRTPEQP